MKPYHHNAIFLRNRQDLAQLTGWLEKQEYDASRHAEPLLIGDGFPRIKLYADAGLVGEVACLMPSLFDEARECVLRCQQAVPA